MSWRPLTVGLIATLLAGIQIFGWLALGSRFAKKQHGYQVSIPLSLLFGSAITAFIYALFAAIGEVEIGVWVGVIVTLVSSLLWKEQPSEMLQHVARVYKSLCGSNVWVAALAATTLLMYWVNAIAPPRDADVLRYHLGHIRQIVLDGGWAPIADMHYAMPFGWSLNYLPFERLGVPQVAHLLNLALMLMAVAVLVETVREYTSHTTALLLGGLVIYQPQLVKAATTAFADMYVIFVMLGIAVLILRLWNQPSGPYGLLGFAAWVAMQSRYQALAIGISVTLWLGLRLWRERLTPSLLVQFGKGSVAAFFLSSPFYAFNLVAFGNPVWPLMVPQINGIDTYANLVASSYSASVTGSLEMRTIGLGLLGLLQEPFIFPLPVLVFILLVSALNWKTGSARPMALLVAICFVIWGLAQPLFYPRFILMLVPLVIVGVAPEMDWWFKTRQLGCVLQKVVCSLLFILVAGVGWYSLDNFQYAATGDLLRFHRFTWFYPVYDWANRFTPADARFLVVVSSGQSYYLERVHRKADPQSSGVVEWPSVKTPESLDGWLESGGYDYAIYEDRDWDSYAGGRQMSWVIREALDRGFLVKIASFDVRLSTLRILRSSEATKVWILKRRSGSTLS